MLAREHGRYPAVVERAFERARDGTIADMAELRAKLRLERRESIDTHLNWWRIDQPTILRTALRVRVGRDGDHPRPRRLRDEGQQQSGQPDGPNTLVANCSSCSQGPVCRSGSAITICCLASEARLKIGVVSSPLDNHNIRRAELAEALARPGEGDRPPFVRSIRSARRSIAASACASAAKGRRPRTCCRKSI